MTVSNCTEDAANAFTTSDTRATEKVAPAAPSGFDRFQAIMAEHREDCALRERTQDWANVAAVFGATAVADRRSYAAALDALDIARAYLDASQEEQDLVRAVLIEA